MQCIDRQLRDKKDLTNNSFHKQLDPCASKLSVSLLNQDNQSVSCENCLMRPLYECYGEVCDENKYILTVFCSGQEGTRTYDDNENTLFIRMCVVD